MDVEQLRQRKQAIVEQYGPWTAYNIRLAGDLYTGGLEVYPVRLRRVLQIVNDLMPGPLTGLRVLDLACLEGLYALEFALHGAEAVGIEGREPNVAKARFAQEILGLTNVKFHQDDVRHLSRAEYGEFDVVLALGILYHLDAPDVFDFMANVADTCRRLAIIDTHISVAAKESAAWRGRTYWGRSILEHHAHTTREQRLKSLWASLDNPKSFWLTRASLYNLLRHVGFTSVYECHNPQIITNADRITLVAVKGQPAEVRTTPLLTGFPEQDWPENLKLSLHPSQDILENPPPPPAPPPPAPRWRRALRVLGKPFPRRVRERVKRLLSL
jgi:2-polyprenyl-3-methyl-5-hydroxy-6-metoxy-1,4-benzoquinol methylase